VSVQLVERGSGRTCVAETSALILATGGFQGSAELVTRYIHVSPHDIVLRASPWSTGDGLTAALRNGAVATRAMDQFYGHSLVDCEQGANLDEMRRLSQYYGCYAVALNLAGLRFADESRGTGEEILNQAVARQPEGTAYYVVDDRIARTVRLPEGDLAISGIQRAKAAGARVITADSLDELTLALSGEGLPLAAVRDTFAAYNDHVSGPMLPGLYPPRTKYRTPIEIAPFHAVRVRAAITFTMGGLSVDATMRLHRSAGTRSAIADRRPEGGTSGGEVTDAVFPNVFAAGCDIGDMSAGGYLGALATALVTGRIAGAQASALATR
jgi:hypothetical protein